MFHFLINENCKKKFIILTLCFTLFFSTLNLNRSYADGGIISLPLLATVCALAVGTGIAIQGNDDLYDMGRMFVDYVKGTNQGMSDVLTAFNSSVKILSSGHISIGTTFLDFVKGFFDDTFDGLDAPDVPITSLNFLTSVGFSNSILQTNKDTSIFHSLTSEEGLALNWRAYNTNEYFNGNKFRLSLDFPGIGYSMTYNSSTAWSYATIDTFYKYGRWGYYLVVDGNMIDGSQLYIDDLSSALSVVSGSFPYNGGYNWDNVKDRVDSGTGDLPLPIPGNVGNLVGQGSTDFWDNSDGLVGNGHLTAPGVDNPSVDIGGDTTFPGSDVGNPDIPDVGNPSLPGVSQGVTDWIVSLVVPTSDYWNNKFNHYSDKITGMFPIDMGIFKDICIEGKPLPDFYLTWQGQRVVFFKGTIINEFAPIARLLVQGSFAIFVTYFNYKRVMRLVNK